MNCYCNIFSVQWMRLYLKLHTAMIMIRQNNIFVWNHLILKLNALINCIYIGYLCIPNCFHLVLFYLNTLRPRQNGRRFADDTFKRIFLSENIITSIKISLKLVAMVQINNTPALVQIMAWRGPSDKPLSGPMMVCLTDAYMRHSASMS